MKIKKTLITTVMGLTFLSFGTGVSAEETDEVTDEVIDSDVTYSYKQLEPGTISTTAAPTNNSTTRTYNSIFDGAYAISKSTSTVKEDYIYARCRTFNGTGELLNTKSASGTKQASISATAHNGTTYIGNDWAIGNHTYKLSGYKTVVHETKAYW